MDDIRARIVIEDAGASASLGRVAKAAKDTGDQTAQAGSKIGQYASTLGLASQAVGKLNPALGQLGQVSASAMGSMQAMSTLGLGPVGIAVAAVSLAVTAGTALWNLYAESNREAEAATRSLLDALETNRSALGTYISDVEREDAERRLRNHMLSEQASNTELEAESRRLNGALEAMRGTALEGSEVMTDILRQRLDLMARMTVEATNARADAEYRIEVGAARKVADAWILVAVAQAAAKRGGTGAYAPRSRGGGGGGSRAPSMDDLMLGRGASSGASGAADSLEGLDLATEQSGFQFSAARADKGEDTAQADYEKGLDGNKTALELMEERDKAASANLKDIYADTFGTLQAGIAASADAMINGGASAEQAGLMIVAALANQLSKVAMMEGLKEAALGIGSLASYDYPGAALHFAAAGAWTLVGAAAGVAGGALSAAAKPSGASGPSTGAGPAPRQQTASEEGARNVTINFAGGVITAATEAQLARTIRRTVSNTALGGT